MVFALVGVKDKNQSLLSNLTIKVEDLKALKLLEDSVTQLQVILPTLLKTITGLRAECHESCKMICSNQEDSCDCARVLVRFNTFINDLEMYVQRANVLKEEAKSAARLVCSMFLFRPLTKLEDRKYLHLHSCQIY
jgi:hypothetical protein